MNKVHHSSKSVEWATPQAFFDTLNARYHFTLDPCATKRNAKCRTYYTRRTNGLGKDWGKHRVFMNPPFGNPEFPCKSKCTKKRCKKRGHHIHRYVPGIADWVRKAYDASQAGALVVALLPVRSDTAWWHTYVWDAVMNRPRPWIGYVDLLPGRLNFNEHENSAPFPCTVVEFRPPVLEYRPLLPGSALQGLEVRA